MKDEVGFIGDIHGRVDLLDAVLERALGRASRLVFLGDYVNRGPRSREVISRLVELKASGAATSFLAGNHDLAFRRAVRSGSFGPFLRMGGAATLASYIDGPASDLGSRLRAALPPEHLAFLEALEGEEVGCGYVAQHHPIARSELNGAFGIFGHLPQPALTPSIDAIRALIDTGSGTVPMGRLTCFLWPSREWFQALPVSNASV